MIKTIDTRNITTAMLKAQNVIDGTTTYSDPLSFKDAADIFIAMTEAAPAVEPAQAVPVAWSKMDYNNLPPEGVYWVVLQSPEYVCDIDDSGNPIGVPTGKTSRRILLAHIEHELQPRADVSSDDYECYPVALSVDHSCKDMQDDEHITHYATPVKPTAQLDSDTSKMVLELCDTIITGSIFGIVTKAKQIRKRLEAGE